MMNPSASGTSFDLPEDADPVVGGARTFRGLRMWEKLFLLVSFINIVITLALTIQRLVIIVPTGSDTPDFTYALVLLINCLFCSYYVIHGVLKERKFELYAFIGAACVVTIYCVIEYATHVSGRNSVKLVRMIMALITTPVDIWLAYMAAREFCFLAFRIVGASDMLQRMYTQTEIFSCFLKFDVQVTVSFVVLVLPNGSNLSTGEMVALIVGVPYTLALGLLGWIAMRKELRSLMWTFGVLCLASPAFVLFKIIRVYEDVNAHTAINFLDYSILAAGALALVIRAMIIAESFIIMGNFDHGLKETAFATVNDALDRGVSTDNRGDRDGFADGPDHF